MIRNAAIALPGSEYSATNHPQCKALSHAGKMYYIFQVGCFQESSSLAEEAQVWMSIIKSFFFMVLPGALLIAFAWPATQPSVETNKAVCTLCFYGPDNVVFDAKGNAYITDSDHKSRFRVLKVSPEGRQIDEWRVFPAVSGRESGPEGIAIAPDGNIWVTDGGRLRILKLSPAGKLLMSIGKKAPLFHDLGHVAIDSSGYIYVSEGGQNRIQKFSPAGKRVAVWQRPKGSGPEEWNRPETITARSDGSLIVEDWGNRRIVILSVSGQTQFAFGGPGQGLGHFENSSGLCVDHEGNIYVPDLKLHRVQKFGPAGKLLSTVSNSGEDALFSEGPSGIAVDAQGNLYAPDGLSIVRFSAEGKLLGRWR